jgi:hypothetical protein
MIDHFFEAGMFEQHVLACLQFVRRLAELVRNVEYGRLGSTILNTGIAVPRYSELQIKRAVSARRKPQVWRHHHIPRCSGHLYLNRAAIERQHQGSRTCGALSRGQMQTTGSAYANRSTAF